MSSPKTYTAKDIERYHRGKMTAAEMHALERAALNDPMLADALEGYIHTTTAAADLQHLQGRLQQRIEEKKEQKKAFFLTNQWMKIAALFVLIAGGGWLVFRTLSNNGTDMATFNAETMENRNGTMAADSVATVQTVPPAFFSDSIRQSDELIAAGTKRSKAAPPVTGTTAAPLTVMTDVAQERNIEAVIKEPVGTDKTASSDIATLRNSAPASTRREAADTGRHLDAVQSQSSERLSEATTNKRIQTARARTAMNEPAEPEGGWPAFEKYITENRKPVEENKQQSPTMSEVELQFDIDKKGKPVNIVVTKSACQGCDAEAIRLLKEGPKWKGEKATVKILLFP